VRHATSVSIIVLDNLYFEGHCNNRTEGSFCYIPSLS